jgi:phenylacetic acid degradation operon negative regulatory protein
LTTWFYFCNIPSVGPTPKSLVLDLLSTLAGRAAPVGALVTAASLFDIAENSLRVALTRLCAEGRVERDARGRYRLGREAAALNEEIRSWRRAEERLVPWSGGWVGVHTAGVGRTSARRRAAHDRALRFGGLRGLAPGLFVRPDNLAGGVAGVRTRLAALGLEAPALVFSLAALDAEAERRARSLWDGAALVRAYRATIQALERSGRRLPRLPRGQAMAESFRLGGAAIRQVVLDPLLPEPIVAVRERHALVEAIRRYDRLGRRVWAGWLGADEPEPGQLPTDGRGTGETAALLRAATGG